MREALLFLNLLKNTSNVGCVARQITTVPTPGSALRRARQNGTGLARGTDRGRLAVAAKVMGGW